MTEKQSYDYELASLVRAFLASKSMQALAETEMDFEWWFKSLSKQLAKIDAARVKGVLNGESGGKS